MSDKILGPSDEGQEDVSHEPIFVMEIPDGYSFRGLIQYLKSTNTDGSFIFTPQMVAYSQCDANLTILNNLYIQPYNLPHYQFHFEKAVAYGLNLSNMCQTLHSIGKKDGLRIVSYRNRPFLYLQALGNGADDANKSVNILRIQEAKDHIMTVEGYTRTETDPNCTVRVQDFCKTCADMVKIRCNSITISGRRNGLRFQAIMDGDIAGSYRDFGSFNTDPVREESRSIQMRRFSQYVTSLTQDPAGPPPPSGPILRLVDTEFYEPIKVSTSYIKALSKLNSSFTNGMVKMYMEPGCPVKLVFDGPYCQLTVYLRDRKP